MLGTAAPAEIGIVGWGGMTEQLVSFAARQTSKAGLALQAVLAAVAFAVFAWMSVQQRHIAPLCVGALIVLGVALVLWMRKREMKRSISVCPDSQTITFREFVVVNSFWPQPPIPELTVSFCDVLGYRIFPGRGNEGLRIMLAPGRVDIRSDSIMNYDALKELICRIVETNNTDS